jgi:hypothetical protein
LPLVAAVAVTQALIMLAVAAADLFQAHLEL